MPLRTHGCLGLALLFLGLLHPSQGWSAPAESLAASIPCNGSTTSSARDAHPSFPDENLERLALKLSAGLYADGVTYDRLVLSKPSLEPTGDLWPGSFASSYPR